MLNARQWHVHIFDMFIAARALATYLIPGCVGRGVRLGSEGSSVGGGVGGDGVWKFGVQQMEKIKILKIQIRSAQNVGKVWISRKKNPPGPIWGHLRPFFPWTEKIQKMPNFCLFFLGGPLLLSTRAGGIGTLIKMEAATKENGHRTTKLHCLNA